MILGDKNRNLLISSEHVIICRASSLIKYNKDFQKEYTNTTLYLPRSYNEKTYDFFNNKITSLQTLEFKEFNVGTVIDYVKVAKEFLFIKQTKKGLALANSKGLKLLDLNSLYHIEKSNLYYLEDKKINKINLITLEKNLVLELTKEPTIFCAAEISKSDHEANSYLVAFADSSNKIHIHNGKSYKIYHWMCNKILNLTINDEYVVAVSKSGDVAQFHTKLQKVEPLFKFNGEFLDLKVKDSKLYFLSTFEFIVFDFLTNSICFTENLIPEANFQTSILKKFVNYDETDVFNIKRKTRIEIMNSLENKNCKSTSFITYSMASNVFIFDPIEKSIISIFKTDNQTNFVSDSYVFSIAQRKSNYIVKIYDFYLDKLVLSRILDISTKSKILFKNLYFINNVLYVQTDKDLYVLSKLNILEPIIKLYPDSIVKRGNGSLFTCDKKGIFNICTKKYDVKQKGIQQFSFIDSKLVFYIETKGIYLDLPDRIQILEISNIIDMRVEKIKESDVLFILYHHASGKFKLGQFAFENGEIQADLKLKLIEESDADNLSSFILTNGMFSSKLNRLLI